MSEMFWSNIRRKTNGAFCRCEVNTFSLLGQKKFSTLKPNKKKWAKIENKYKFLTEKWMQWPHNGKKHHCLSSNVWWKYFTDSKKWTRQMTFKIIKNGQLILCICTFFNFFVYCAKIVSWLALFWLSSPENYFDSFFDHLKMQYKLCKQYTIFPFKILDK